MLQDCCWCLSCLAAEAQFQWVRDCKSRLNLNPMEEGEQYSEYLVERNPRAYMSMRDYRNQWMSSPYGSAYNHSWGNHTNSSWEPRPPQCSPPEPPYYAPTSQQQPPTPSPVEQAILNLSKIVDNFIVEQRAVTVQANQETDTVELLEQGIGWVPKRN